MKLKDMSKEELENMSYDDIAYAILTEKKKKMKIIDLFMLLYQKPLLRKKLEISLKC